MKKDKSMLALVMFTIGSTLFAIAIVVGLNTPSHTEKTDCYDKHSNKIIGAECEVKVLDSNLTYYLLTIGAIFIAISLGLIVLDTLDTLNRV